MLCLLLSLLVVPVGYSLVEEAKAMLSGRRVTGTPATATGD